MSFRQIAVAVVAAAAVILISHRHSHHSTVNSLPRTDDGGDPYITDRVGRSVLIGTPAAAALARLGGISPSGPNGQQVAVPGYDYPVRGTGNPDDVEDNSTVWWQFCVSGGRVVSKQRGTFDQLPTFCP